MATRGLEARGGKAPGRSLPRSSRLASASSFDLALGAVGLLTVVAFVLRLPHLSESLVGDEMYAFAEVHDRSLSGVIERVREGGENSPPLFFLLAWAAMKLGDPTVLIRLPSLLLGTATVPLVYVLGVRTVGRHAALIAAALLAVSPFAIFYSTEARPYTTLTFLVSLSTLALVLALESSRRRWWVLYAVTGCLALYAHYFAIFALIAQGGWALWTHRERFWKLVLANAAIVVGYVPWLLAFLDQKGNSISILAFYAPLNAKGVGRELLRLFPGHPSFLASELPGRGVVVIVALALIVATAVGGVETARRAEGSGLRRPAPKLILVCLLALAPMVGFYLYSVTGPELFIARYLSAALPFVVLVLGAVLAWPPRAFSLPAAGVVVVGVASGALASFEAEHRRPAYKDAAHYIDRHARPGDAVVQADLTLGATRSLVIRGGRQQSLDVNFERDHDVFSVFQESDVVRAFAAAARRARFLLVGPDPLPRPPEGMSARLVKSERFPGSLPLTVRAYSPADPASGFETAGLAKEQEAARRLRRKADALAGCLSKAGLDPRRAETSPPGSIAVETPLTGRGRSLLFVYSTPETASRELPAIAGFLEAAGGEAKRKSDTVVGYTTHPTAAAASRVEGCV
jgi:mannosyltransferase